MKIGSWSHVGSRWHLLGAIFAQDDPEDRVFIDFWPISGRSNFPTPIETLFSSHGAHKRSKVKVQNNSKNEVFSAKVQNPKIVLSPTHGLNLRGLKQSIFWFEPFASALDMVPWYSRVGDLSRFLCEMGAQRASKNKWKNGVQKWWFRVERSSSSR